MDFYDDYTDEFFEEKTRRKSNKLKKFKKDVEVDESKKTQAKEATIRKKIRESKQLDS